MRLNFFNKKMIQPHYSHRPKKIFGYRLFFFIIIMVFLFIPFLVVWQNIELIKIQNSSSLIERFSNYTGLKLEEIHIVGRSNLSSKRIREIINLKKGIPLLTINLETIKSNLLKEGWVKNISIERKLPNIISIKLEEHLPFALLQVENENFLVSADGEKISSEDIGKFSHLPVIMGKDAENHATKMLDILTSEPDLFHQVWAISFIGKRRWDVHLRSGIKIKLPENKAAEAWSKLADIDRKDSIISRDIISIDLRVNGNLVIEPGINKFHKKQST